MRALGLDVGQKTIGLAMSDELGIAAHPLETLARRGTEADAEAVARHVADNGVADVVVGWPLEMSGKVGHRARRVDVFIQALEKRLPEDVQVHRWDERFSTVAVERVLIAADLSRKRRKQVVDKQAAAYILQGWLDGRPRAE